MSDIKTNIPGLVVRRGGDYPQDLPYLLVHAGSNGITSEHVTLRDALDAARRFGDLGDWSGRHARMHTRADGRLYTKISNEYMRAANATRRA